MLPFLIYSVTAVLTGFHVYVLLSYAVYGAPVNLLELVCLLGSFCMLVAAYISLFRPRAAARLALIAALTMWSFYGPAIARMVQTKQTTSSAIEKLPPASSPVNSKAR